MVPTPVTDLTSRRTVLKTLGAAAAAGITGVTGVTAQEEQFGLSTVASFDPPQLPENIAVTSDGTHYLSMATSGEIWSLTPDDDEVSPSSVASLPLEQEGAILLGITATDEDDALYACVNTLEADTHGVWRVPVGDGEDPSLIAETDPETSTLNGITTEAPGDADALVTDHQRGLVLRVSEDDGAETWLDSPLLDPNPYEGSGVGIDGIGVGPDGDVFVDNLSFGSILRIPAESDGSAGEPEVLVQSDDLVGSDGLTVDSTGSIYVAVNAANAVVRVDQEGEVTTVAAGEAFDFPADVHFGRDETERTLYVCNFAIGSLDVEGQEPNPGYVRIDLGAAEEAPATPDETPTDAANETEAVDGTAVANETETVNETEAINETDVITKTPTEATNETATEGVNETEP